MDKKKLLVGLLSIACAAAGSLGLASCGHKHAYNSTLTIAPTCTEQGYTTHRCECGDSYTDNYESAIGHEFTDYISNDDATCTKNGTETAECERWDCEETDTRTEADSALGHEFVYYISNDDATCTEDGTETAECRRWDCEETDTRTDIGSMLDHIYDQTVGSWKYLKSEATCTSKAVYYKSCVCGKKGTQTFEYGSMVDHIYDQKVESWEYLKTEATCTNKGVYYKSCTCGEKGTQTFETEKREHVYEKRVLPKYRKSEATCISSAVYYKSCSCGVFLENETFEFGLKGSHRFGEGSNECEFCSYLKIDTLKLDKEAIGLFDGENVTLNVTYTPSSTDPTLVWRSSNSSVAKVENGKITALSTGKTEITVSADGLSVSCKVMIYDVEDFIFENYGNGYTIVGYTGIETEVYVPSSYEGRKIYAIGSGKIVNFSYVPDGFTYCYDIKKIVLPETVMSINFGAFGHCKQLEEITIPESCSFIARYAFYGCSSLKEITLPNACSDNLQMGCFAGCPSLEKITVPRVGRKLGLFFESVDYESTTEDKIYAISYYESPKVWYLANKTWIEINGKMALYQGEEPTSIEKSEWVGGFSQPTIAKFTCYYIPTTLKKVVITGATSYPNGAFENCSDIEVEILAE